MVATIMGLAGAMNMDRGYVPGTFYESNELEIA